MYEDLVLLNTALVKHIALKFKPSQDDLEDFIQAGYIGLLKSAKKFCGGVKFSTYAYRSIQWEMSKYSKKISKYRMKEKQQDLPDLFSVNNLSTDLSCLTEEEKLVIEIRAETYAPIRQIAKQLNRSPATIYRVLNSAIKKLKNDSN